MADETFLSRLAKGIMGRGPNRAVTPIDDTTAAPPTTTEIISASGISWAVPGAWLKAIAQNADTVLAREGTQDLTLYDRLLDDDVAFSTFQQRRLAVVSREWEVAAGDENDPRSVEAADHLRGQLKVIAWDHTTDKMLFGVWYGYAVAECLYKVGPDLKIWLDDIVVPDRRWFGFTNEGELRFIASLNGISGDELPANTFWVLRTGGSHDFAFYGLGLGHWAYWPIWFKRSVMQFWALALEKMGRPTAIGPTTAVMSETEKAGVLNSLVKLGKDSAATFPDDAIEKVKFLEQAGKGSGMASYKDFITEQNEALMRITLGQPGTSKGVASGLNSNQADTHADVKAEIVKADSDLACETFNRGPAVWLTRWNFGPDVAPPRVYRQLEDTESLDAIATRDKTLFDMGIKRTEESILETYGEGYEYDPAPPPPTAIEIAQAKAGLADPAAANDNSAAAKRKAAFAAMGPTPLYVSRKLINAAEVLKWARGQGFTDIYDAADLHVTVLYSKTPVDWFEMGEAWTGTDGRVHIQPGGARTVEIFGHKPENEVVVLRFASSELKWRHESMIERGGSSDHPDYSPYVSFANSSGDLDLTAVEPFTGELVFGPEIFERIDDGDMMPDLMLDQAFTAADLDAIDALTEALMAEANPVFAAMAGDLRDAVKGAASLEGIRVALLQAWERLPVERLAQLAGLPLVATRAAAEVGAEDAVLP